MALPSMLAPEGKLQGTLLIKLQYPPAAETIKVNKLMHKTHLIQFMLRETCMLRRYSGCTRSSDNLKFDVGEYKTECQVHEYLVCLPVCMLLLVHCT